MTARGRLSTLADPATGVTATYSYNDDDQVTGISYGSGGDTESLGYDSLHRLTSQTLQTGSGSTVASVSYGYDPDGQVTSMATTGLAGPSTGSYGYDEAGRLTSWDNGTTTTQYGYDGDGNLTRDGTKSYTYDARDELTSDGTSSYTYTARGTPASESSPSGTVAVTFDAYGDQATAGSRSYTYDALGRLTASQPTGPGTGGTFSYAGKSSAIASDGAATYTWDPSGSTLVGTGAAGGGSGILALTDAHGDVLGQFAPAAAAMAGSQAFDPWGTVTATTGSLLGGLGFQGAWADPATGKDLMGARWYDPAAGDFTSADSVQVSPVPDPAAGSPYAYAADDPLSGTDPTGHPLVPADAHKSACPAYDPGCPGFTGGGAGPRGETLIGPGYKAAPRPLPPIRNKARPVQPRKPATPRPAAGSTPCNSVASRYAPGGACIAPAVSPERPGGAASFLAGPGSDVVGLAETGMCGANLLQCLTNKVLGVPSLDSLYQSWLRSLGVDTSSDSTYTGGQIAGLILSLAAGGALGAGEVSQAAVPAARSLASDLASATGGTLKNLDSGYSVTVPQGSRGIMVRIMEQGGGRTNYYRVSIPGKQTFTVTGEVSTDPALTHIPISSTSLQDILNIIAGIGQ